MSAGAPVGFGGVVLPNPNNIKPMADTDQPPTAATPLAGGATMGNGVYYGGTKMDASNPASAQIIPGMMRTAATKTAPNGGPGLAAVIADKEFQGFSPAEKRQILSRVTGEKELNDFSDGETMEFISRATARLQSTRPDLFPPPGVPRPQPVNMQQSPLGSTDYSDPSLPKFGGMHGGSYEFAPRDENGQIVDVNSPQMRNAAIGGTAGIATYLNRGTIVPAAKTLGAGAVVEEGVRRGSKALGINLPDWVPAFAGMTAANVVGSRAGNKSSPKESAGESAAAASSEAEASGTRVPVGKLAKEVPNPDPYKFSGAPKSMDIVDSTNVGKVGYEPDSRTMTVEYKNGFVYSYHGVPQEIYQQSKDAESIGSYISRNVKGRYETVRRGSVLVKKR